MILVAGSVAIDHVMDFPGRYADHILPEKIHIINLSFQVDTLKKERGGTGANIAYNLALLGEKPKLLATVGEDFAKYRYWLEKTGVDTQLTSAVPFEFTSSFFVFTDKADNQIGAFYQGAMKHANELSIKTAKLSKRDFVIIAPTEVSAMTKYANECQELDLPYLFDPGMQLPRFNDQDLKKSVYGARILIGNDYEIEVIKKRLKMTNGGLRKIVDVLVTTLGEKGSLIETKKEKIIIPPVKPNEIVDPTGAGDAYRAGFMKGYLKNLPLAVCGKMGSLAASYAIEKYGTTNHWFNLKKFKVRYQESFGEKLEL